VQFEPSVHVCPPVQSGEIVQSDSCVQRPAVQPSPCVHCIDDVHGMGPKVRSSYAGCAGVTSAAAPTSQTRAAMPFADRAMMWAKSGDDSTSASGRAIVGLAAHTNKAIALVATRMRCLRHPFHMKITSPWSGTAHGYPRARQRAAPRCAGWTSSSIALRAAPLNVQIGVVECATPRHLMHWHQEDRDVARPRRMSPWTRVAWEVAPR
jgi:hypothetical protein